jgi:hypothetical protein
MSNHARTDRVELNVSHTLQEVALAVDHFRTVTSLPKSSRSIVGSVEVADIGSSETLRDPADSVFASRRHKQVNVIGHQDIGMNVATKSPACLAELLQEEPDVGSIAECWGAVIAPLYDMVWLTRNDAARQARHEWLRIGHVLVWCAYPQIGAVPLSRTRNDCAARAGAE